MSDIAIKVENLSKRYRIGRKEEMPETFIEAMTAWLKSPLENFRQLRRLTTFDDGPGPTDNGRHSPNGHSPFAIRHSFPDDIIWALKDVSFEVKQGEVVGVIGRNGAGKSTLLKILSRITEPTSGRAVINGRVSSLLEVGTGFHPELTGRENMYLNGTILGMSKAEVDRKFDEIVDFSGVEKFIDTPVKRYSSGMKVRLAFAVAAHLEPEILLVDEVLAVGDVAFQEKCLGKMEGVTREGRTVIFVSHNMAAIETLCPRTILVDQGMIAKIGSTAEVVEAYLGLMESNRPSVLAKRTDREGTGEIRLINLLVQDSNGREQKYQRSGEAYSLVIEYQALRTLQMSQVSFALGVFSKGSHLFSVSTEYVPLTEESLPMCGYLKCHLPHLPLTPGVYHINAICRVGGVIADWIKEAGSITVIEADYYGTGRLQPKTHPGFFINHNWTVTETTF